MTPRRENPQRTWKDRRSALKNLPPAFGLLWDSAPTYVACVTAFRVVIALMPVLALWIGKRIIDQIVAASQHAVPHQNVFGVPEIWWWVAAEFVVAAAGALLSRAIDFLDGRIGECFSREVNLRVMKHAADVDLESIENPAFRDKMERARVQGQDRVGMLTSLGQLVQQSITLISLAIGVLCLAPSLFWLVFLTAVPAFLSETHFAFLGYSLAYSLTPLRRELDYLRDLTTKAEGAKELKVFGLAGFLSKRFQSINEEVIQRNTTLAKRRFHVGSIFSLIAALGYYGSYAFLISKALDGTLTIGTLTFLAGALTGSSGQIQLVFSTFTVIADQALFLTDLFEFLGAKPRIRTRPNAIRLCRPIREGFEFVNVSFAYPGSDRLVLNNINLKIGAKERIALVGSNGEGKTTLVKLMSRLYEPTSGEILLDGVDIREYDLESLHQQIGVIFQDFARYDFTARENIAVGRIEQADDESLIEQIAKDSGVSKLIQKFPDGFDQMLGRRFQDGVDLSGGEWQKFALARAYMRDAQILILDEPTAALDAIAEHDVFTRFTELAKGRMTILISHRLSTIRMADRIVVLHDGRVHEQGTHQELMKGGRRYANMFGLQASGYLPAYEGTAQTV